MSDDSRKARVVGHIDASRAAIGDLRDDTSVDTLLRITDVLTETLQARGKVLLFGNGGSATDAQHIAAELVGRFMHDRSAAAAIALTTDSAIMTSIGNDYGFDAVFARQVEALGCRGDVAIGISTSGRSRNVLSGLETARARGLVTIALAGGDGGDLPRVSDHLICVASTSTPRIQECHAVIGHLLCELVEDSLLE